MIRNNFEKNCEILHEIRNKIKNEKRLEYTEGDIDVLSNFRFIAAEQNILPTQVLYVYLRKHFSSISRFCANPNAKMSEPISLRIVDAMNFLELLYALTVEEQQANDCCIQCDL